MSNLLSRVKADHAAGLLRATLGSKYEAAQLTVTGTVVAANLIAVGGQQYRSEGISATPGSAVSVRNIGTPAKAIFGPATGGAIASTTGSHSTTGTVGTDHAAVTLATPSALTFADQPTQAGLSIADSLAGNGLTITDKVIAVGAGAGITVNATTVALTTPGDLTATSTNSSTGSHTHAIDSSIARSAITMTAGDGLTGGGSLAANRTFAVGAGAGITVSADAVALTTPGSLSVASTNSATGSHTHAISSSANPGSVASLLASDATGKLTLPLVVATTSVTAPLVKATTGAALTLGAGTDIILSPTSTIVRTATDVAIQASDYASQTTGWRVTDAGEADFRYLFVDELHAKSFIADLEQALAGGQIISKSVAVVAADFTLPAAGAYATLRVRDLPSAPNMAVFQTGDFVGLRQFDRSDGSLTIGWAWGVVTLYADGTSTNEGTQTWRFTRSAGTPGAATGTIPAEAIALDFGTTGNGFYEVNAIDGAYGANSPYAQVVTWATHPATQTVRSRFGHLRGIFNVVNEYGLYAGSGTGTADRYIRASSSAVELRNVPLALYAGANNTMLLSAGASNDAPFMAMGSTLPTAPLVGNGLWMGKDGADYEFRIGTVSAGALTAGMHWNGSSLSVVGSITITNTIPAASVSGLAATATSSDFAAVTGATKPANNATVGAAWGSNLTGRPTELTDGRIATALNASGTVLTKVVPAALAAPGSAGLYLGGDYLGYYSGSAWRTYMDNAGKFYLTGAGGSALAWDGSTLGIIGAITATSGEISGDFAVTGGGKLTASGGGIVLTASGINIGLYPNIDGGATPPDEAKALAWYDTPGTASGLQARQYVGKATDGTAHWNVTVNPGAAAPLTMSLWYGGASLNGLWFTNLATVTGLPGLLLAKGTPNTVQVLSGARLQLNSGSTFSATTHLATSVASTYDIGASGTPWRKIYVDEVIAGTITGSTSLGGQIWQYDSGDMYIRSTATTTRTIYIANPGTGTANLNVEGAIVVGGTVDGVDLAAFKTAYDTHDHSTIYYTKTNMQTSGAAQLHWANLTNKPEGFAPASHVLATNTALGAEHTISGATAGHVLRASSASAAAFAAIQDADLPATITRTSRTLTAGNGLTGGGDLSANRTFTVGAGAGITVNATTVALTTPGSLTATSTNSSTGSHTHAIDSTIARSAITLTAGDGLTGGGSLAANRTFTVGAGAGITVAATTVALATTVAGNGLTYTTGVLAVGAGTGITVAATTVAVNTAAAFTWTGAHTFQNTISARHILPELTDTYDIGSATLWWNQQFVSQINATIFAEQTIQLLGGWFWVPKDAGILPAVSAVATTINFSKAMTPGNWIIVKAHDASGGIKTEYMTIGTLVSGTTYNVTRDTANAHATNPVWADGTPYALLGANGDGRIELNAYDTPRISMIRQGATYNAQTEIIRIGDLNGMPGVTAQTWGAFIGDASQYLKYANGVLTIAGDGSGLTSISGSNITTGTLNASLVTVTNLSASNITTGTLAAARIATGSLNASKIESGTITTAQLDADAINGMTITGSTVRTAASGARVQMDSTGIKAYNAGGTALLTISASTGALSATSATISGAITATSGSIAGTLAIGAAGKITTNRLDIDQTGANVRVATDWDADAGYRFNNAGATFGGVYGYSGAIANYSILINNKIPTASGVIEAKDSYTGVEAYATTAKTAGVIIQSVTTIGGAVAKVAQIALVSSLNTTSSISLTANAAAPTYNGNAIWHAGNDGAGSGLEADTLDGYHATSFALSSHTHAYEPLSHTHSYTDISGNGNITTTGTLSAKADTAASIHALGYARIGHPTASNAMFAHKDHFTNSNYAIAQTADGYTFLNCQATKYVGFRNGDDEIAYIKSNQMYLNGFLRLQEIATAPASGDLGTATQAAIFAKADKLYIVFKRSDGGMRYYSLDLTQTPSTGANVSWVYAGTSA